MSEARTVNAEYLGDDMPEIPVIRIQGKAAAPALWPITMIGVPAAVALLFGAGNMRRAGAAGLAFLGYLWFSGKWPPEGTQPAGFFGGGRFAGTGAGR